VCTVYFGLLLYIAAEILWGSLTRRILSVHGAQSGKRSISKLIYVLTEEYTTVCKTRAPREMTQVGRGLDPACMQVKVEW
jgi:hypothetical protein